MATSFTDLFIAPFLIVLTFSLHSPASALTASEAVNTSSPSPAPAIIPYASPPAPPADMAPFGYSPEMSPGPAPDSSPVPAPAEGAASADEVKEEGRGKMGGGSKAGIVVGVLAAAVVIGVGGVVLKKRRENIRRAKYASAARREFLADL